MKSIAILVALLGFVSDRAKGASTAPAPGPEAPPQITRQWRPLPTFGRVEVCAPFTVLLIPTPNTLASTANYSVLIRAEDAALEAIRTTVTQLGAPAASATPLTSVLRIESRGDFVTDRIVQILVFLPAVRAHDLFSY